MFAYCLSTCIYKKNAYLQSYRTFAPKSQVNGSLCVSHQFKSWGSEKCVSGVYVCVCLNLCVYVFVYVCVCIFVFVRECLSVCVCMQLSFMCLYSVVLKESNCSFESKRKTFSFYLLPTAGGQSPLISWPSYQMWENALQHIECFMYFIIMTCIFYAF